jgi:hypothetical protein
MTQITTGIPINDVTAFRGNTLSEPGSWEIISLKSITAAPRRIVPGISIR